MNVLEMNMEETNLYIRKKWFKRSNLVSVEACSVVADSSVMVRSLV